MAINLDQHDEELVKGVIVAIRATIQKAHQPAAVARRIAAIAVRHRNAGRSAAMRRHPFSGVCEISGMSLSRHDAVLDERQPELGYAGEVRWVCPKANNSGKRSCGGC